MNFEFVQKFIAEAKGISTVEIAKAEPTIEVKKGLQSIGTLPDDLKAFYVALNNRKLQYMKKREKEAENPEVANRRATRMVLAGLGIKNNIRIPGEKPSDLQSLLECSKIEVLESMFGIAIKEIFPFETIFVTQMWIGKNWQVIVPADISLADFF